MGERLPPSLPPPPPHSLLLLQHLNSAINEMNNSCLIMQAGGERHLFFRNLETVFADVCADVHADQLAFRQRKNRQRRPNSICDGGATETLNNSSGSHQCTDASADQSKHDLLLPPFLPLLLLLLLHPKISRNPGIPSTVRHRRMSQQR